MDKDGYLTRSILILVSIIFLTISPGLGQPDPCDELEGYLDCTGSRTADIVIVMDTTGSMTPIIDQMKGAALDFANALEASDIDYMLGLTEYKDFDLACDSWCGGPGDFPYDIYGLTANKLEFDGWISGLFAWGGADTPESVLAAMSHTATDQPWREGDAQKVAILMCDAPPHPDGDCCNAEGDTLASTISDLTSSGVKVYVVYTGSETDWATQMASATGGRFYSDASSIRNILDEIVQDIDCSFNLESEADCRGDELKICTQILGKDGLVVPYSAGNTEAWAILNCRAQYALTYDAATESYCATVPPCAETPFDVAVYGKVCEWETSQTITVNECNQPPDCSNAAPSMDMLWPPNHKFASIDVIGVTDPDGDPVTITIESIYQDEPVDTNGDGSFTPDGQGIGTPTAEVRAERTGDPKVPGNGRVYHISFTASDGFGGICEGEVLVNVPHDQNKPVVDDGSLYDSTVA